MNTTIEVLKTTMTYLKSKGIESYRTDSEILLCETLKCDRIDIYTYPERIVTSKESGFLQKMIQLRGQNCPVAYILGEAGFMSLKFKVNPDVLIPRPETEHLVERAIELIGGKNSTALDIGTGSGNIAISIAKYCPQTIIFATDISPEALLIAKYNTKQNKVEDRITFCYGDLFYPVSSLKPFDFILSNPPYISEKEFQGLMSDVRDYEPSIALLAGDGYNFFRRILNQYSSYLKPEGRILLEMGAGQSEKLQEMVSFLLKDYKIIKDYSNIDRVIEIIN